MPCNWIEIMSVQDAQVPLNFTGFSTNGAFIIRDGIEFPTAPDGVIRPQNEVFLVNQTYTITEDFYNQNYIAPTSNLATNYDIQGNYVKVNSDKEYFIVYKETVMNAADQDLFNEDTMLAICYYVKWIQEQAKVPLTGNITYWMQMKDKYVSNARNSGGLNDNAMDKLFNIQASWDRKRFNHQLTFRTR